MYFWFSQLLKDFRTACIDRIGFWPCKHGEDRGFLASASPLHGLILCKRTPILKLHCLHSEILSAVTLVVTAADSPCAAFWQSLITELISHEYVRMECLEMIC